MCGPLSVQTVGVCFRYGGRAFTLYARLAALGSDGEGLKIGLDVFGWTAIRPCIRCENVLRKDSGLMHRRPGFVEITCSDRRLLTKSTQAGLDADIAVLLEASEQVAQGTMGAPALKQLEQAYGIHANANGLLADRMLKEKFSILAVITEDWMHGCLQDGVLNMSHNCLMAKVAEVGLTGVTPAELTKFLKADWEFPKVTRNKSRAIWRVAAATSHETAFASANKMTAAELLTYYVLLRHFVETVVAPKAAAAEEDISKELNAFQACCRVVDLIMLLKKGHAAAAHRRVLLERLRDAVDESIALHIEAYGTALIRAKHHRMQHIADQIDEAVVDAFTIERLHLLCKEILTTHHNPVDYEASLMRGFCLKQIMACRKTILHGAIGSTSPFPGFPGATMSTRMRYAGMDVCNGDFVYRGAALGRIIACVHQDEDCYVIAEVWGKIGRVSDNSSRWRRGADNSSIWHAGEFEQAVAWYCDGEDIICLR